VNDAHLGRHKAAALRDFDPVYDRYGSCVTSADVSISGAQLYER
jgi:hypothetical protein